ncbi:MAG: hypothetical protein GX663_02625 [Clostridiales bacterium]|nr:hypothetical protein [Clostridiales bacterium]
MTTKLIITLLIVGAVYIALMLIYLFIHVNRKEYVPGHTRISIIKANYDISRAGEVKKVLIYNAAVLFLAVAIILCVLLYVFFMKELSLLCLFVGMSVLGAVLQWRYKNVVEQAIKESIQ